MLWFLQRLRDYTALGVNRFSMGVQSFQQEMLSACGRSHTLKEVSAVEVSMVGSAFRRRSIRHTSPSALLSRSHVQHCSRSPAGLLSSAQAVRVSCRAAPVLLFMRCTRKALASLCCSPFGTAVPENADMLNSSLLL